MHPSNFGSEKLSVGPLFHVSGCEMAHLLARSLRHILSALNLVLDIQVMVNGQLSTKGIHRPVSYDCIAGSGIQFMEATYFLVIRWPVFGFQLIAGSGLFLKVEFTLLSVYGKSWITWERHFLKDQLSGGSKIQVTFERVRVQVTMIQINEQH